MRVAVSADHAAVYRWAGAAIEHLREAGGHEVLDLGIDDPDSMRTTIPDRAADCGHAVTSGRRGGRGAPVRLGRRGGDRGRTRSAGGAGGVSATTRSSARQRQGRRRRQRDVPRRAGDRNRARARADRPLPRARASPAPSAISDDSTRCSPSRRPSEPKKETDMTNHLHEIEALGQSIWLDNISRQLIESGKLERLVVDDGISGVTSNPSIFEKAMGHSDTYDDALRAAAEGRPRRARHLLPARDRRHPRRRRPLLRPTWDRTGGADGHISFELLPELVGQGRGRPSPRPWLEAKASAASSSSSGCRSSSWRSAAVSLASGRCWPGRR